MDNIWCIYPPALRQIADIVEQIGRGECSWRSLVEDDDYDTDRDIVPAGEDVTRLFVTDAELRGTGDDGICCYGTRPNDEHGPVWGFGWIVESEFGDIRFVPAAKHLGVQFTATHLREIALLLQGLTDAHEAALAISADGQMSLGLSGQIEIVMGDEPGWGYAVDEIGGAYAYRLDASS